MLNGLIGPHIVANEGGYSRDRAIGSALEIVGRYHTVVNDPQLCQQILDLGGVPIHRINRRGLLDDQADEKGYRARDYVLTAHTEVPDKRALLYLVNEPGQNDLQRLGEFVLDGVNTANALGRKLVCFNWSYGNPEPGVWDALAPVVREIVKGGHYIGFHEGYDIAHPTLASCYPDLIGRFLAAQRRFGFKAIVTEFAASKGAHDGWRGWLSWQQYAALIEQAVQAVYAPNGVPVTPYTLFPWQRDFDYVNEPGLKAALASINARYPLTPPTPIVTIPENPGTGVPMTVTSANGLKHRAKGNGFAPVLRVLARRQAVTAYPDTLTPLVDGWRWVFCRTEDNDPGWSAVEYLAPVLAPETWTVNLQVPFVSQLGNDAARSPNDCGVACLLMLERDWLSARGLRVPSVPTVDDLTKYTPLAAPAPPKGLTFAQIGALAQQTGFDAEYIQPMTTARIVSSLNEGKPVMVLLDYSKVNPAHAAIAHILVVSGYSDTRFLIQDPYQLGADVSILKTQLEAAMISSPGNSVGYQGMTLR